MVQGIAYGILHVYSALIDDPVTCRHRSRTDALLLLRQVFKWGSHSIDLAPRLTSSNEHWTACHLEMTH